MSDLDPIVTPQVSLQQLLYALSDINRLKIVMLIHLSGGELKCGSFADKLQISKPTLSHHFNILRESGVIATRVQGTNKLNRIRYEEVESRFPGLLNSVIKAADGLVD